MWKKKKKQQENRKRKNGCNRPALPMGNHPQSRNTRHITHTSTTNREKTNDHPHMTHRMVAVPARTAMQAMQKGARSVHPPCPRENHAQCRNTRHVTHTCTNSRKKRTTTHTYLIGWWLFRHVPRGESRGESELTPSPVHSSGTYRDASHAKMGTIGPPCPQENQPQCHNTRDVTHTSTTNRKTPIVTHTYPIAWSLFRHVPRRKPRKNGRDRPALNMGKPTTV